MTSKEITAADMQKRIATAMSGLDATLENLIDLIVKEAATSLKGIDPNSREWLLASGYIESYIIGIVYVRMMEALIKEGFNLRKKK